MHVHAREFAPLAGQPTAHLTQEPDIKQLLFFFGVCASGALWEQQVCIAVAQRVSMSNFSKQTANKHAASRNKLGQAPHLQWMPQWTR